MNAAIRCVLGAAALLPFASCSASGEDGAFKNRGGSANGGGSASGGNTGINPTAGSSGINPGTDGGGGTGGVVDPGDNFVRDDCPGSTDANSAMRLKMGGPVNPSQMKWYYPYDSTVFPRGILPPVLQWAPVGAPPANAVLVHIKSNRVDYWGCFGAAPGRLELPLRVWQEVSVRAVGPGDPLNVELTTLTGSTVSGPIKEKWVIANATLKGAIYYNTYGSPQAMGNAAVMRIVPSAAQPAVFVSVPGAPLLGPCVSCHSLSANGQRMVSSTHTYPYLGTPYPSTTYNLQSNPASNPPILASNIPEGAFGALTPDGSLLLTTGTPSVTPAGLFPMGPSNVVGMTGPLNTLLFDTTNGQPVTAPGLSNVQFAKMPMFSPNGDKVVFNHHEASNGHSLAVMDFNPATKTFSNLVEIYRHATLWPGWPFFTPDSKGVVFVLGNADDYVSHHPGRPLGSPPSKSDIYYVDIASKSAVKLARAGGFNGSSSYLPYPGRDEGWEYFTTVSPVSAGGYFWAFFTSRRNYGNILVGPADDAKSKKIWVTAIDINAAPGSDASHPAFYLPGQEIEAGNVRAFAALEACKQDGQTCSSGIDCCCGACTDQKCGCPTTCSKLEEKCKVDTDCCDPRQKCIGGFCGFDVPS